MKRSITAVFLGILISLPIFGVPVLQMNKAFIALSELIPFITNPDAFIEKKNEKFIVTRMTDLQNAFKAAKHETVIKEDLFAPSYTLINENISGSIDAFKNGSKEYAHWRLREITSLCIDCHTRMPPSHASSFQNGEISIDQTKFKTPYDLGVAQLIVRRYTDAKESFIRSIQDKLIKKETRDLDLPFKQVLLIETKVLKSPENLIAFLMLYNTHKEIPAPLHARMNGWLDRLNHWKGKPLLSKGLASDKEVDLFIRNELSPLKNKSLFTSGYDIDLLIASGLLSNYLFENPTSPKAAEITFWLGWSEKYLKRENFFSSGDLFLKQCIKRHAANPVAKKCLEEYKESVVFEFSGSSGTNIPRDVQKELEDLESLIKK